MHAAALLGALSTSHVALAAFPGLPVGAGGVKTFYGFTITLPALPGNYQALTSTTSVSPTGTQTAIHSSTQISSSGVGRSQSPSGSSFPPTASTVHTGLTISPALSASASTRLVSNTVSSKSAASSLSAQSSVVISSRLAVSSAASSSGIASNAGRSLASSGSAVLPSSSPASGCSFKSRSTFRSSSTSMGSSGIKSTSGISEPASQPSSSSALTLSSPGCPPVPLTLQSLYSTITLVSSTTTLTLAAQTFTQYAATATVLSTVSSTYTYTLPFTTYGNYTTYTYYSFVTSSVQTTTTVPTPAGFTPVKCEAIYNDPTTVLISTTTGILPYTRTTSLQYSYVSVQSTLTITSFQIPSQVIVSGGPDYSITSYAPSSTTITITRSTATSTVYAACATNNITPDFPGEIGHGVFVAVIDANITTASQIPAIDAVDCCSICQSTPSCVGSAYGINDLAINVDLTQPPSCVLYTTTKSTCHTSLVGPQIANYFVSPLLSISNGACGQYGESYKPQVF